MEYRHLAWLSALSLLFPYVASAQTESLQSTEVIQYQVMLKHSFTQPAQMRILAREELSQVEVTLTNCGPSSVKKKIGHIAGGSTYDISWKQPKGTYQCKLSMKGSDRSGRRWKSDGAFEMKSLDNLGLSLELQALSADVHELIFHASHPVSKLTLSVIDEDGATMASRVEDLNPPQKDRRVEWEKTSKKPAVIEVRVDDDDGVWSSNTVCSLDIPHEDLVFDTGKSNIRSDQEHKLQDTLDRINEAKKKYDRVEMSLYITGYTDTVGSIESNDKLSRERARSIASWIRRHGLNVDTYYRGLGERVLYKKTDDETPEESNRRVQYTLTNIAPVDFTELPSGKWNKI